ncbi:helix-turn-helix transcriptional regulator [Asticcacaulis solisilvae]|uniref:helix-turn-helix transcriptional regulator n=1 Tax=Asticcacaulis solisilvae TaxID=1217274 RepID=UPI003FD8302E
MYERAQELLRLALMMQGSRLGISLDQIRDEFAVSRRTAERMRDAVRDIFPDLEEVDGPDRQKCWRLPAGSANSFISYDATELQDLNLAIEDAERQGLDERAANLKALRVKLSASLKAQQQRRIEPDLESLIVAEGFAVRPGPRPKVAQDALRLVRTALMRQCRLQAQHRSRRNQTLKTVVLEPCGLLFGPRVYLVACSGDETQPKLFALDGLSDIQLLDASCAPRPEFSLRGYAEQAFGIFQEKEQDIVWRFRPEVSADVRDYHFHPRQQLTELDDGSIEVSFTCGGLREMGWHLFTWGEDVEIVSPPALREHYRDALRKALAMLD